MSWGANKQVPQCVRELLFIEKNSDVPNSNFQGAYLKVIIASGYVNLIF